MAEAEAARDRGEVPVGAVARAGNGPTGATGAVLAAGAATGRTGHPARLDPTGAGTCRRPQGRWGRARGAHIPTAHLPSPARGHRRQESRAAELLRRRRRCRPGAELVSARRLRSSAMTRRPASRRGSSTATSTSRWNPAPCAPKQSPSPGCGGSTSARRTPERRPQRRWGRARGARLPTAHLPSPARGHRRHTGEPGCRAASRFFQRAPLDL